MPDLEKLFVDLPVQFQRGASSATITLSRGYTEPKEDDSVMDTVEAKANFQEPKQHVHRLVAVSTVRVGIPMVSGYVCK